jgi:hypothetical protein
MNSISGSSLQLNSCQNIISLHVNITVFINSKVLLNNVPKHSLRISFKKIIYSNDGIFQFSMH